VCLAHSLPPDALCSVSCSFSRGQCRLPVVPCRGLWVAVVLASPAAVCPPHPPCRCLARLWLSEAAARVVGALSLSL